MAQAKMRIEDQNSFQGEPLKASVNLEPFRRAVALAASGLTLAEGQARLDREPARAAQQLAARKMARLDRHRMRTLRDGEEAPALTPADLKALAAADRLEASAVKGKRGAPSIRAEAARKREAVGTALIARGEARRADLRLAQTVALDAAREGVEPAQVLEAKRGQTGKRLRTRDGLKMLHESGALTPKDGRSPMAARIEADRLLAVGLRYRDRYEIAQASLKSCLATSDGVRVTPTLWSQCRAAQRRAALANQVRVLDVAVATRLHPDALVALRMIAGEARTLRSITTARRRQIRLGEGLAHALVIIGDILSAPR